MIDMPNPRFTVLVELFFSDRISERELLELDLLLKQNKGFREEFIARVKLLRQLSDMAYLPKGMGERQRIFRSILERAQSGEGQEAAPVLGPTEVDLRTFEPGHFRGRRRKFLALGLAASLLLLLGATLFFQLRQKDPSLEKYRDLNVQAPDGNGEVRLIVQGKEIEIAQDNPSITYSEGGEKIDIDQNRTLVQETGEKEILNSLVVPYGKRSSLLLSDGTKVWLNSGSTLTYPSHFREGKREVLLNGQAIFEVAHSKGDFYVLGPEQVIRVLGTVFDVRSYADEDYVQTVLKSGSVEIGYPKGSKKIRIRPGTLSRLDKKSREIIQREVDPDTYMAWREGVFVFENENLEEIAKTISRYYGVKIELDGEFHNVSSYSGRLDMKNSVDDVLDILKGPLYFDYSRESERIIITN